MHVFLNLIMGSIANLFLSLIKPFFALHVGLTQRSQMTSLSQNNAALCPYFREKGCATLQRDDISKNAAVVTQYAVNFAISTAPVPMTTLLYLLLAKSHFLSLFKSEIDLW